MPQYQQRNPYIFVSSKIAILRFLLVVGNMSAGIRVLSIGYLKNLTPP